MQFGGYMVVGVSYPDFIEYVIYLILDDVRFNFGVRFS